MTLLQITAVEIQRRGPRCCRGLINHAAIGRGRGDITAVEIADDVRRGREEYFAMIGGVFVTVVAGHCTTCDAPFLVTEGDTHLTNRLLSLPALRDDAPERMFA